MVTSPGDCRIRMLLLYAVGILGGPVDAQMMHRSCKGLFSGPSNSCPRFAFCRSFCLSLAAAVSGGIFPSGGSMIRDVRRVLDRKSTRLNSSHRCISYAVFCLKKKNTYQTIRK